MGLCLVVYEQPASISGLASALARAGHVVLRAQSGRTALGLLQSEPCSVVILAYLPVGAALEACRLVRSAGGSVPLVALGVGQDERLGSALLQAGVDVYLPGPASPSLVIAAVEALLRRIESTPGAVDWPERVVIHDLELDLARGVTQRQGQTIELTPSEFRILRHLALNAGRVISSERLAREALGHTTDRRDASDLLKVHVRHLREKIEADPSKPVYLVNVRGLGYMLERRRTGARRARLLPAEPVASGMMNEE
ncbi:MAG: response regulator transcription factor [Chloroflexi bacterium]|nr:response regulator transcription factor [Chloroflexota bacterium]